jgi:hypothetical protein
VKPVQESSAVSTGLLKATSSEARSAEELFPHTPRARQAAWGRLRSYSIVGVMLEAVAASKELYFSKSSLEKNKFFLN